MQLHDADCRRASVWLPRIGSSRRARTHALASRGRLAWGIALACTICAACGDDGTEGLSACPDAKIVLDKDNVLRCAPPMTAKAGTGGSSGKAAASAGAKSTASNTQADTGTKPAAAGNAEGSAPASGAKPPANSGSGQSMPAAMSGSGGASNPPASNSGAMPAASGGGNPTVPDGSWNCVQVMDECSCAPNTSTDGLADSCTKPHPTCCTYVTMNRNIVGCLCVPDGSEQCKGMRMDSATYPSVSKCPP